jgi:hypothetical protein
LGRFTAGNCHMLKVNLGYADDPQFDRNEAGW